MNSHFYVAIEGPIGVGKTTLARMLCQELGGQPMLEVFEENPFLSDFYADRARYAFQTQIFFLLSRYRQQGEVVARLLEEDSLASDYLFAKDRLFARLNLGGSELDVYERLYAALSERVPVPHLVVYLRAPTEVLMHRIAFRDRSYERSMSREYIDDLRVAYEQFFADYDEAPVLSIDTTNLDIVAHPDDRHHVVGLVRAALEQGPYQQPLPEIAPTLGTIEVPRRRQDRRRLGDLQRWHRLLSQDQELIPDLYLDYMGLMAEVGALGQALKSLWLIQHRRREADAGERKGPQGLLAEDREQLRGRLAGVLAGLLKIANDASIDLEEAYVDSMAPVEEQP